MHTDRTHTGRSHTGPGRDGPSRLWHRTSVRTRAAAGAALASLAAFGLAGVWVGGAVHDQWTALARKRAEQDIVTLTNDITLSLPGEGEETKASILLMLADGTLVRPVRPPDEGKVVQMHSERWFHQNTLLEEYTGTPALPFPGLTPYPQDVSLGHGETLTVRLPDRPRSPHDELNGPALDGRRVTLLKRVTDPASTEALEHFTGIGGLPEQRVTVFLLVDPTAADQAAARITTIFVRYVTPGAVLFTALVAWWVTGLALRPVEGIRRRMARIGDGAFHERVPVPPAGDGITRLAVTTNATLDRLELALNEQRRLVSDASHELRSPLAALRSSLEVPLAHPAGADWPQVVREALADTGRLQLLTDDLLLLAATDERHPAGPQPRVDLSDVVAEQLAELAHLAAGGPAYTAGTLDEALVEGSEILLGRLVRNLLDNASRHAAGAVTASVVRAGDRVELTVTDDGPGIAPEDRERVFDRFVRLDAARDRADGGGGLGLSLVRSITGNLGGTVAFTDPPAGTGARVVVRLPAARGDGEEDERGVDGARQVAGRSG
ncbi:sensor histidine kinase [Kitasatospora indigofera]|uniref:sensor histidine kinase n=1 Tax=Kitasatospora indigofera TaxID=67307 RepID=UPI00367BA92E